MTSETAATGLGTGATTFVTDAARLGTAATTSVTVAPVPTVVAPVPDVVAPVPDVVAPGSTFGDLAAALGLTESTVSHHMTQLRRAGLVESERRGMNVYHRPHRDAVQALCAILDPNCCT